VWFHSREKQPELGELTNRIIRHVGHDQFKPSSSETEIEVYPAGPHIASVYREGHQAILCRSLGTEEVSRQDEIRAINSGAFQPQDGIHVSACAANDPGRK
jgi:hypothetical protein